MGRFNGVGPLIFALATIITGIEDCKAKSFSKGTWCRFKGNLNCGDYNILCTGRGFIDCTGKENDEGFWNVVQVLTDPILTKIFKMKMKQSSGGGGVLTIEKFLDRLLNEDMQDEESEGFSSFFGGDNLNEDVDLGLPVTGGPFTEELVAITNSELFTNEAEGDGIQLEGVMDDLKLLHLFELDEESKFTANKEEHVFHPTVDLYEQNKDHLSRKEPANKFKRKIEPASSSVKDLESFSLGEHKIINTTVLIDTSNDTNSMQDFTSEKINAAIIGLNSKEEIFLLEKELNKTESNNEKNSSNGVTTQSGRFENTVDSAISKSKRSINLLPYETHNTRNVGFEKTPINRFKPNQRQHRPYRNKASIFELQRRLENIHDTLKNFKKTHSVKIGQVTTEVALKILASDILHKLHSTTRRVVRDVSSSLNLSHSNIYGDPDIGTCRVFNMTCLQPPPLSACSGAGIGGCIG
ncbi:uncharacterized protein [Palaemon carinicauda]|uniref:uncharacterized protein isoform X2 n=1 Tax=Palaemon carinicauda TaxID=392227 RepID=UPI0035B60931